MLRLIFPRVVLLLVATNTIVDGFSVHAQTKFRLVQKPNPTLLSLLPDSTLDFTSGILQTSTLFALNMENSRQYVTLIVICAVLLDIICGSPMANLLLAPMRRAASDQDETSSINADASVSQSSQSSSKKSTLLAKSTSTERIDTVAVAQAAIQKAKNTMELRKYLEDNKTDKDRMEDLRKKIDSQLRSLEK
jgi:hypothetical protein